MRTYVYIDGFNLYYGALRGTPYKWLDLKEVCRRVLQAHHRIDRIKYFTAITTGILDPDTPVRQRVFIRALQAHIPEFEVYYGHFLTHKVSRALVDPADRALLGKDVVRIWKTEEKGSDVNLAVHLVNDAHLDKYDCAVVVSSDGDLAEAMRIARDDLGKKVGLIQVHPRRGSYHLKKYASFVRSIRPATLRASQLPDPIPGTSLRKPASW